MSTPSTEQVIYELVERGFEPTWDMLTNSIRINKEAYTEKWRATIFNALYDAGVKSDQRINRVLVEVAHKNPVHAVWDTLTTLPWDGQDHIGKLAMYFTDAHDEIVYEDGIVDTVFGAFLRRWLIGCVARAHVNYQDNPELETPQNRVLILGGGQGLGKSFFAKWLAKPFAHHFKDTKLDPDDPNINAMMANTFLWEIAEADSIFGKVNKNSLKRIITQSAITFKHPYGRTLNTKAPMTNWIGTFNPDGPIFEDQTGGRRWAVVLVDAINKAYSTEIDVNQVWAHAYNLYLQGETYVFSDEEKAVADAVNKQFTDADHLEETMQNYFTIGNVEELRIKPVLISEVLSVTYSSNKDKCAKEAAYWLAKQGCEKVGNPKTWRGVCLNEDYPFHTDVRFKKIMHLIQENLDDNYGYDE